MKRFISLAIFSLNIFACNKTDAEMTLEVDANIPSKTRSFNLFIYDINDGSPKDDYAHALEQGLNLEETKRYTHYNALNQPAKAQLTIANFYLLNDELEKAEHHYLLVLAADPGDYYAHYEAHYGLGVICEKRNDLKNAEEHYILATKHPVFGLPQGYHLELAEFYEFYGDLKKAEQSYTTATQRGVSGAASKLITLCEKLGKTKKAKHYRTIDSTKKDCNYHNTISFKHQNEANKHFNNALENDIHFEGTEFYLKIVANEGLGEAQYTIATYCLLQNNLEEAEQYYKLALITDPKNANVHHGLGILYEKKCDLEKAEHHYILAQQYDAAYTERLEQFYEDHGNFEKAQYYHALASATAEDFTYYLYRLGYLYDASGNAEKAEQCYIASGKSFRPWLVQFYKKYGIYERAEYHSLLAIDQDDIDSTINYNIAFLYERVGNFEKARFYHNLFTSSRGELAMRLADKRLQALHERVQAMANLHITPCKRRFYGISCDIDDFEHYVDALRNGRDLEDTVSHFTSASQKAGLCNIADFYLLYNDAEKAKQYYTRAANLSTRVAEDKENPEHTGQSSSATLQTARAYYGLGVIAEEKGDLENAANYYILAMGHGGIWYRTRLADFYEDQKDFKKAELHYSIAAGQGDSFSHYHLALLYEKMGQKEKAQSSMALAKASGYGKTLSTLEKVLLFLKDFFSYDVYDSTQIPLREL